jgi:hypothetical protein
MAEALKDVAASVAKAFVETGDTSNAARLEEMIVAAFSTTPVVSRGSPIITPLGERGIVTYVCGSTAIVSIYLAAGIQGGRRIYNVKALVPIKMPRR